MRMPLSDAMSTVTHATALSVTRTYQQIFRKNFPKSVVICGGGGKNHFLVSLMARNLPPCQVMTSEELGIPVDQVEATSFALMALETVHGRPSNEPTATGARRPVVLGLIAHP